MSRTRESEIRAIIDERYAYYDDGAKVRAIAALDGVCERDVESAFDDFRHGGRSASDVARDLDRMMRRD